MVEMVELLEARLGKRSVERVRYVINYLLHLAIVKYGDISLVLCISTRLRLVTILSLLVKYLIILHADPCNKSYISDLPTLGTLIQGQVTRFCRILPMFRGQITKNYASQGTNNKEFKKDHIIVMQ